METLQIYVKNTSNCAAFPLQTFERLGPEWTGENVVIPFGEGDARELKVVGWTDLYGGQPCNVHVAKVAHGSQTGWLVWGGNSGVRILDPDAEPIPGVDDHLPPGYGRPIVWIEDSDDLPDEVRAVVALDGFDAERLRAGYLDVPCENCGGRVDPTETWHATPNGAVICEDCAEHAWAPGLSEEQHEALEELHEALA